MSNNILPRIVITAPKSGSGKTMITCGLLALLKRKGFKLSSRKCGPDYIDPMFHRRVLQVPTGNLDTYFTDEKMIRWLLASNNRSITIIEGVMGYYDGLGGDSSIASTYEVAKITETPAILVVDAKGASVTLAALIKGIVEYRKDSNIKGVILNRISPSYYERIKSVIEKECGVKVFGYVPNKKEFEIPSRHLGLIQPEELEDFYVWLKLLADTFEETLDVNGLLKLAETAPDLDGTMPEILRKIEEEQPLKNKRIAVARDEAFTFYYEENIKLLEMAGASISYFSPIHDAGLPEHIDGLILGGGYPEIYAEELSKNVPMHESIKGALKSKVICLAECGGFLYLQQSLEAFDEISYKMVGALSGYGFPTTGLKRFGYMMAKKDDTLLRGHEFHHFDCSNNGNAFIAYKPQVVVQENRQIVDETVIKNSYECMVETENLLAGFPHFYYMSSPQFFVDFFAKNTKPSEG